MQIVRTVLALALALTVAGDAGAADALTKCRNTIVASARRLFEARYKAHARCETTQANGGVVACTDAEPSIEAALWQARAGVEKQLTGACPPAVLAQVAVGAPCASPPDAVALTDCLADQVVAPRANALIGTAFDDQAALADKARFACQKSAQKAMRKLAGARQKLRAACAANLAAGRGDFFGVCPDAKTLLALEKARTKAVGLVEKKCALPFAPEPDADLDFGEPCEAFENATFDRGPGGTNALPVASRLARCLAAAATEAADAVSGVVVRLPDPAPFTSGVAAGDATPVAFVAWTRADGPGDVELQVATNPEFAPGSLVHAGTYTPDAAADGTVKVDVGGLTPDTTYYYRFRRGVQASRTGRIRTAPAPSATRSLRFVLSGDSNAFFKPFTVLDAAVQDAPDLFLYVGDTIYGDDPRSGSGVATTRPEYQAKYRENREDPSLRNLLGAAGTVTIWDDHEVVNDFYGDGWPDPARIAAGNQAFRDYMPLRETPGDPQRLHRSVRWGTVAEFFVLDDRQYRSPQAYLTEPACLSAGEPAVLPGPACLAEIDDPARTYLGAAQKAWLQSGLLNSTATFKFLVNGPPMSGLQFLPYDRWEGYAAERREILEYVAANAIENVIVLSTDIHAAIVNQVANPGPSGGDVLEVVGGAIGMDPIYRELPASILSFVGSLPALFPSVQYFDLDRWSYVRADVGATEAVFTYRDAAGTVLKTLTVPAE